MDSATRSLGICAVLLLNSCASMRDSGLAHARPLFEPTTFFDGRTRSSGLMESRFGAPAQRVTTETVGRWQGDTLRLEQNIVLGDGKPQHRSWRIRKLDAHRYEAMANDMVGSAIGQARGNTFHWSFTLALSPGNLLGNVRMSQWMYLQPDGRTMINHSTIRKFGIVVAQVREQFRRQTGEGAP